jgi:hypothetical protein
MTGPTTDIEIMSDAALLLGKKPFTTIDDADEFAVSVQAFYDLLVPSELSKVAWKFAKKQVQLSQIAGFDPDFAEWDTAYALPGDFLMLVRIYPNVPFQIFEDRIYTTHDGELKIEYNYQVPVTKWLAPFKEFMTYSLAAAVGSAVAENDKLVQRMEAKASQARAIAMFVDGQNSPNRSIQSDPWLEARYGRYGNPRYNGRGYW